MQCYCYHYCCCMSDVPQIRGNVGTIYVPLLCKTATSTYVRTMYECVSQVPLRSKMTATGVRVVYSLQHLHHEQES